MNAKKKGSSKKRRIVIGAVLGVIVLTVTIVWLELFSVFATDVDDLRVLVPEDVDFLNSGCGAEFVQKSKELPRNFDAVAAEAAATAGCVLWASFDGDADRVVMFYAEGSDLVLLDGDKMACLLARSIAQMLVAVDLRLSLGVVQTAYANGASTVFLKQTLASMGCSWDIATVATGVASALLYGAAGYSEARFKNPSTPDAELDGWMGRANGLSLAAGIGGAATVGMGAVVIVRW